jgi:hypothetical protein
MTKRMSQINLINYYAIIYSNILLFFLKYQHRQISLLKLKVLIDAHLQ